MHKRAGPVVIIALLLACGPLLCEGPARPGGDTLDVADVESAPSVPIEVPDAAKELFSGVGDAFVENRGQLEDDAIRFYAQGGGVSIGLTDDSIIVVMRGQAAGAGHSGRGFADGAATHFSIRFDGCERVRPVGRGELERTTSYFIGNDSLRWVRGARSFSEVVYEGLWEGVDLVLRLNGDSLKYDIALGVGADPRGITFAYDGVQGLGLDASGDLLVRTGAGELRDGRPVVFQEGVLPRVGAQGRFVLRDGRTIGFELPAAVDPRLPALIDPGLVFSTFIGGVGDESFKGITKDGNGNYLVTGWSSSHDFPVTNGSYDPVGKTNATQNCSDIVVARFDPAGQLKQATYIGGTMNDHADDVDVGPDGTVYVAAYTNSTDGPVTPSASRKVLQGFSEALIIRLSADLSDLLYCSYFGGRASEGMTFVDVNDAGLVSYLGLTNSSDLPTTAGAYCTTYVRTGERVDSIVLVQLDAALGRVVYCTYINGIDTVHIPYLQLGDVGYWITMAAAADGAGDFYVAGMTAYGAFPVTPGAANTSLIGGTTDCFVLRLSPRGGGSSDLVASTFFGGTDWDHLRSATVLVDGRVCIGGETNSIDLPITPDAIFGDGDVSDGFVAVLDGALASIEFCTYIGGLWYDDVEIVRGGRASDRLYVVGLSSSPDMPYTPGCFDHKNRAMDKTHYVAVLNITRPAVDYLTFMGGSGWEDAVRPANNALVEADGAFVWASTTSSSNFPVTRGAFQSSYGGGVWDAFLLKLDPTACALPEAPANFTATPGSGRAVLRWEPQTMVGYRVDLFKIYRGTTPSKLTWVRDADGAFSTWTDTGLTNGRTYYYGVSAINSQGEGPMATASVVPIGLPGAPQNLKLTTGDGTVRVTWSPPASTGGVLTGYRLLRGPSAGGLSPIMTLNATTLSYKDLDVVVGATYHYGLLAFNDAGNGTTILASIRVRTLPSPPTGLSLVEDDRMVNVYWSPPLDDGASVIRGYRVYRGDRLDNMSRIIERDNTTLFYNDLSLTNGMSYCYYITATTADNESAPSELRWASPYGPPPRPTGLQAVAGNLQVSLTWSPPATDNGRPITNYVIRWGTAPVALTNSVQIGNATIHIQAVPENGVTYFFQVAAVNLKGAGLYSAEASATPMGTLGRLASLQAEMVAEGVMLSWEPPTETGGAKSLIYIVQRMGPEPTFREVGQVKDGLEFLDNTTVAGVSYTYRVAASTPAGPGPYTEVNITVILPPSRIDTLTASAGDGLIELRWSPPATDGGSGITAYFILKRGPEGGYALLTWTLMNNHTDREVVAGSTYTYYVVARNDRFNGTDWREVSATAVTHPGAVGELRLTYTEGAVELSWLPSTKSGAARTTGYVILRGLKSTELKPIAEVGPITFYRDGTVEKGNRYYYQVIAKSDVGPGDPSGVQDIAFGVLGVVKTAYWPLLIALVALVAVGVLAVAYRRRARAATGAPTVHIVEEVLVVLRDGRLIADSARDEARGRDAEVMTGMLTAIQGFAKDGLERGGILRSISYEDNTILMASGTRLYVAAVVYGLPDDALRGAMEETVRQLEATYGEIIDGWDGDLSVFAGVSEAVRPLVERTRNVTREDVQAAGVAPGETEVPP